MINLNKNTTWNLTPIDASKIFNDVYGLLIPGEEIIMAFISGADQLVFTNERIISIDMQSLLSRKWSFLSMPYSKIQFFAIQTQGSSGSTPDSELCLTFSNDYTANFSFKGNVNIGVIGRTISQFVLK